jgi:uncharacterized protein YlxW (UPF0749 family)
MVKNLLFNEENSVSMGLLNALNKEIETNDYQSVASNNNSRDPKWLIALLLAFAGLIFGISIANTQRQEPILEKNRAELRKAVTSSINSIENTAQVLSDVNNDIATYQALSTAINSHGISTKRQKELQIFTGLTSVKGPGLVISLNDATNTDGLDVDQIDLARVFDSDVQLLVNSLWSSGAESISINGNRLVATSAIRAAGEAILVNYRPLLPPYKILVIGSSDMLSNLAKNQEYKDLNYIVKIYGLVFKITKMDIDEMGATSISLPDIQGITLGDRS